MARQFLPEDAVIGQRLRRLRERRGLSKAEAAVRWECTENNLEYYESGRNKVRVAQLGKWASVYAVDYKDLVLYLSGADKRIPA